MFEKVNVPILGVVENMSYLLDEERNKNHLFGQGGGASTAQALKCLQERYLSMKKYV